MRKFKSRYYVQVYQLTLQDLPKPTVAKMMGISLGELDQWIKTKPTMKWAYQKAIEERKAHGNVASETKDWVYGNLSEEMREVWDRVEEAHQSKVPLNRIEALLKSHGAGVKKNLFLYALTTTNFNASKALTKLGLSKKTLDGWIRDDPDFATLVDEVQWHMKNYFESKLMRLVKKNDPQAILHVNKTKNRDRGYGEKTEVEVSHSGTVQNNHVHSFDLSELKLPPKIMRVVLQAAMQQGFIEPDNVVEALNTPETYKHIKGPNPNSNEKKEHKE